MSRITHHESRVPSPYYPPRAGWNAPLLRFGDSLRRRLRLDRFALGASVPTGLLIAGALIPGLACYLRWPRTWGKIVLALMPVLLLVFVAGLGYPAGNLAFGALLSAHVTGFVSLFEARLAGSSLRFRLVFTVTVLAVLALALYLPLRDALQAHWLLPLRSHGQVVVVNRLASAGSVHRGDWVAYTVLGTGAREGVVLHTGLGLGVVLALPGDRLRFTPTALEVNEISVPRLDGMPGAGELVVPDGRWFIWPDLRMVAGGHVAAEAISASILNAAQVRQDAFLGKPFKRWFLRRQILGSEASARPAGARL